MARRDSSPLARSDIVRIVSWTVVANGLIVLLLAAGGLLLAPEPMRAAALQRLWELAGLDDTAPKGGLAVTYVSKHEPQDSRLQGKTSLNLTLMSKLEGDGEQSDAEIAAPDDEQPLESESYEDIQAMAIQPILRQKSSSGGLEIGSFKPIVVSGNADACVDIGHSMLQEVKAQKNLLEVMVESEAITIAKICTKNGAIILTCRANQITISPRRSRPDDGC